jgi:hypothetical protein
VRRTGSVGWERVSGGRRGLLSHGAAEEYRAQEKNTLDTSSFASLVFPEVFCHGSAHVNGNESNSGATARHLVAPDFLALPGPAWSTFRLV